MDDRDLMVETITDWKNKMKREDVPDIWWAYIAAWRAHEAIQKVIESMYEASDDALIETALDDLVKAQMDINLAMENCEHEIWGPRYEGWYDLHPRLYPIG